MGGVDLFDQKFTSYHYGHKCRKWYHAICHFIRERVLVNSYTIFKPTNPSLAKTSKQFKQNIAGKICASFPPNLHENNGRRSLQNLEENEAHLTEGHSYAAKHEASNYKQKCTLQSAVFQQVTRKGSKQDTVVNKARMEGTATCLCSFQTVSKSIALLNLFDANTLW